MSDDKYQTSTPAVFLSRGGHDTPAAQIEQGYVSAAAEIAYLTIMGSCHFPTRPTRHSSMSVIFILSQVCCEQINLDVAVDIHITEFLSILMQQVPTCRRVRPPSIILSFVLTCLPILFFFSFHSLIQRTTFIKHCYQS